MSLTPEDIKELRRLLSEATAGTWIDMGDTEPWPGTVIATTVPDGGVTPVCIDPEADDRPADRACIAALHNAAPALLDAADALATLRLEHESWGAIIDGLRATVAEMRTQRDADVMTALMRQSEVFDVTFATVTRERDEARKALATEEHNHELTIARRDDAQSWADSLANQIAEAADHEIGEHSNLNNPWDNAQDGLVKLVRERDELRAALLNERGEGEPPAPPWAWIHGVWERADGLVVGRDEDDRWCFEGIPGVYLSPDPNTARETMRQADTKRPLAGAALAGGRS